MRKSFYLDNLEKVRSVIEVLPDDARICRIYDDYDSKTGRDTINIQIGAPNALTADRTERLNAGSLWAEKYYAGVTVGWVVYEEDDDEAAV